MEDRVHPFRSAAARDAYLSYYDERAGSWPVPSETRLVGTSFGETFVRISGSADAPPLVLVPGDGETSLAWTLTVEALAADYRAYCLDHIYDIGRSIWRRRMKKPTDFVQWLDELLTALDLDDVNLMGHSYGGWMSSLYALAHPDRLSKLVLLAPVATVLPAPVGLNVRAILYGLLPFRFYVRRYMYWYAPESVRRAHSRLYIDAMVEEQLLARRCFKRRRFIPPTVIHDRDWQALRVPTLFLVGDNEVSYSARAAVRRLERVAPSVTSIIAAEADHHLAVVAPDWTNEQVLKFLRASANGPR